ncbi:MAG TPA: Rdx family protein [Thermoanaerobaculia bacterium]|nr:Rdx family protein [Thermoanaerobaculia bacterium]
MPKAASLAATIKQELGIDSELIAGDRGVFDVKADGATVFSKYEEDRFPTDDEILRSLRTRGA